MSKLRKSYTKAEKLEIVSLSMEEDQNVKDLAERFGISQNTIYKFSTVHFFLSDGKMFFDFRKK